MSSRGLKASTRKSTGKSPMENKKIKRTAFKFLQADASTEKKIVGRPGMSKFVKLTPKRLSTEVKKCSKSVQTSPPPITKDDLVSEENDKHYWQQLAEKRQEVLDDSLSEIERLKEDISILKEENSICNEMLNESMHLVEVLKEIVPNEEEHSEDKSENN